MGRLRREPDDQSSVLRGLHDDGTGLERLRRVPGHPEAAPHDAGGVGQRGLGVPDALRHAEEDVPGRVPVEPDCPGRDRLLGVRHRGERIVLHLHHLGKILRRSPVRCDHGGNGLTHVANPLHRQGRRSAGNRQRMRDRTGKGRGDSQVGGGEDQGAVWECRGDTHRPEPGVCHAATDKGRVQHAGQMQVPYEPPLPGQQARIFPPAERGP